MGSAKVYAYAANLKVVDDGSKYAVDREEWEGASVPLRAIAVKLEIPKTDS